MRRWRVASMVASGLLFGAGPAAAHHVPGHGTSEGVRNLHSLGGGTAQAQSRVMVLHEVAVSSTGLNPGTVFSTALIGEYAPHRWVSLGLWAPLLVVAERDAEVEVGYGDTRVMLRVTPHSEKLIHRVVTAGLNVSLPTRTVELSADPGRTWSFSPYFMFTRTYRRPYWQVLGLATVEQRPAGVALDGHVSAQAGMRTRVGFTFGVGILADLRLLNFCALPGGGQELCPGGRSTEEEREIGAVRIAQSFALAWALPRNGLLGATLVLPLTSKRDFDASTSLSLQFSF